ncbi:MAG: type II secretion system major pseudopilin GspG [Lysobacteraceae bacterium]
MRFQASPGSSRASGMSLIEIIIVIVLIGTVLVVVGQRVFGSQDRANVRLTAVQLENIGHNVEQFQMDVGRLPNALDELISNPGEGRWLGPYVRENDLRDPWGNAIQYEVPGQSGRFALISLGADGRPGGESVNADIRFEP